MCDSGCRLNEKGDNNHNQAFGSGCRLNEKGDNNHNQALRGSWRGLYGEAGTPLEIRQFYVLLLTRRLLSVLPTWWRVYVQSLPIPTEPFEARCLSTLESEMLLYIQ